MVKLISRYRFLALFIILIAFCLFKAVYAELGWTDRTDVVFGLLTASSLLIIGQNKHVLLFITALVLLKITLLILQYFFFNETALNVIRLFTVIIFLILMTYFCLCFTLQDQTISITTLFGSLSAYLFIGFIFAYIYLLIELVNPSSFAGLQTMDEIQAIYFSFITLTTVGFGEIIPLKPIAQTFVWLESFTGQSYLAIIIGQLISRYVADRLR
ncbi:Inward rectifier potassium channel Kirbac3, 1 [Legionella santicrucis]|uniref:Inward rectifier potassium channel Kirbac3, 1 n=1 Tax=Legionella santicrucis TaxID=45074 RepID=A0A0W0YAV8_9GAMM|nr:ion channel [Legionella santicrucis]KTD53750.1 Inward rectifier potassium channel Kirbac3, 1 [Legionella santicrucis]